MLKIVVDNIEKNLWIKYRSRGLRFNQEITIYVENTHNLKSNVGEKIIVLDFK
jgi:hypothetical protein